jgi:(2R)-sulfolactate sulfo-lyase subunit alpha
VKIGELRTLGHIDDLFDVRHGDRPTWRPEIADRAGDKMIHFVVHDEGDAVGVVVVEGVKKGQDVVGWIMDQDKEIKIKTVSDIPIGHKLAIKALKKDDTVIKYGVDIGRSIAPIKVGEHAHVHNIKTKRW